MSLLVRCISLLFHDHQKQQNRGQPLLMTTARCRDGDVPAVAEMEPAVYRLCADLRESRMPSASVRKSDLQWKASSCQCWHPEK